MALVRCLQCGAINDTGAADYPFCVGCQDNLAKCGYCQRFDQRALICTEPRIAGVFDASPEATPPCVYHLRRASAMAPRRGSRTLVAVGLAAALFVVCYSLWLLRAPAPPPPHRMEAKPQLESAAEAVVGGDLRITLDIINRSDQVLQGLRVEMPEAFFRRFALTKIEPEVSQRQRGRWWRELTLPALEANKRQQLVLTVVPSQSGRYQVSARLFSSDDVYYGMAVLPIKVRNHGSGGEES